MDTKDRVDRTGFWRAASQAKREVESWPEWKKASVDRIFRRPSDSRDNPELGEKS